MVGPKTPDEGPIDLEEFFWRQRPYFYGTLLSIVILSFVANIAFLKSANTSLFIRKNLTVLPMLIPVVLALLSRARWAQWVAGLSYLAMDLAYTVLFCSTLS